MTRDIDRLKRLLGGPELTVLRNRLRARFERNAARDEFTLTDLAQPERRALAGLLGKRSGVTNSMRLRLSDIDAALVAAGLANSLREALEALDGPIHNLKVDLMAREEAWIQFIGNVQHPRLSPLIKDPVGAALTKRFSKGSPARAAELLEMVARVISKLPGQGQPLAHLAAAELGDAHALDSGRPVATLTLRSFALGESAIGKDSRRAQWARLGISVTELAAPALCLNLPATGDSTAARIARAAFERGEPVHLSLRMLLRDPPLWEVTGRRVFICENPAILSMAADKLGVRCAPLLCTNGMPAAAQQTLLRQLHAGGAHLNYHGDFDWDGISIGNYVIQELCASAWRFSAQDYDAACAGTSPGSLAKGKRIDAIWDSTLSSRMSVEGKAIHEEAVGEHLIGDLVA